MAGYRVGVAVILNHNIIYTPIFLFWVPIWHTLVILKRPTYCFVAITSFTVFSFNLLLKVEFLIRHEIFSMHFWNYIVLILLVLK